MMSNRYLAILLIAFLGLSNTAIAQQADKGKVKAEGRVMKGVSGEVSGISKDFIAIVYHRDPKTSSEEEIALPIAKDVKLEHKKSIDQIGVGDVVDVRFEEIAEETKEGIRTKRVAKVISFVRAAPAPKPESSVLVTGGAEEEEEQ